jgi:hypothetical protein
MTMDYANPCGCPHEAYENPPSGDEFADIYAQAASEAGGNGDVPWQDIIGGGVSIINTAIKGAYGAYDTPTAPSGTVGTVKYDPYAKKAAVPTWVWIAGAAGVGLLLFSQRRRR